MDEKVRVLLPIEIPNLDKDVDTRSIWINLNTYVKTLKQKINLQDMGDWRLLINVLAQRTDAISVAKRVARFPSDKEYVIYMSIPIPDDDQATYGLSSVKEAFFKEKNEKYSYILEPNFDSYDNLHQYIIESSKLAINLVFTHGFTCNGKKIKFQK
ncbi:MAG: hypothetical protein GX963_11305 [Bacteroidales bacterium]|nr:hypothetical protein [Bacteroidales bacterium]